VENEQKHSPITHHPSPITLFSELFRAIVRPVVTIMFAAVIAHAVTTGLVLPDWFLGLSIPLITFWFGERAYKHHAERSKKP
jgi:uncharacterized membrane protein YdbT with pleckstrin-like domain